MMIESMCVCTVYITRDESILETTYGDTVVHEVQGINEPSWSLVRVTVNDGSALWIYSKTHPQIFSYSSFQ